MKIALLQDRLRLGGTEAQALSLASQWRDMGHDPHLVVFRPGGELADSPAAKKLPVHTLQKRDWGLDFFAPGLRKTLESIQPDVVVAFGREANAKLPGLARLSTRPALVATLRSGREQPARYWRALQTADAVVANAEWAVNEIEGHKISKKNITIIYSGIARDTLPADPAAARADWRKRAHTPDGAVVLICVATFRRVKGHSQLLRAVAMIPSELDWQLWLVGDGPWLTPMKRLAAELGLKNKVRFTGRVDDPSTLYAAADVAVLASLAEALPNFLIEAQTAGLPVIATDVGGAKECFEEKITGIAVPLGMPEVLAGAITRAIRDPEWRESAREPARARAKDLFDATRNATRWAALFKTLRKG